jgi:hypothetical protein
MSATLSVRVTVLTYEKDLAGGAKIVGDIYPAGPGGVARRNIVFPCGVEVAPARFDVEPGRYIVSATLPSGVMLTEGVEAREGVETTVTLDASDSPDETLSWQYLMGNIEPSPVYHNPYLVPAPRSVGSRYSGPTVTPDEAEDPELPKVVWLGDVEAHGWSFESMLALIAKPGGGPLAHRVPASPSLMVVTPDETDGMSHLFRFGPDGPLGTAGEACGVRQFLTVELADTAHLVTLPAPWDSAMIEVLVNARQSPTGSTIAVTVRDHAVGAGLAYLARGALDAAARLFTEVESALFVDLQNPLAAAAAAYAITGTDLADEPRHWDPWLESLRHLFGWMSDGSVLWAVRRLRRARTESDLQEARDGLIEAYDRGVPLYTRGLSWLMDALSEFPEDPECAWRLENARQLSWYVDMREPFVIVNVRERPTCSG